MARGYPDFFGTSIVPKYGAPQQELYSEAVVTGVVDVDMVNFTGKGRSYSGYASFYGTGNVLTQCTVRFILDGIAFPYIAANSTLLWNRHADFDNFLSLSMMEITDTVERFCLIVCPDWTWSRSCIIQIHNSSGANVQAICELYWAKVI